MSKTRRYQAYAAVMTTVIIATGCVVAPSGQNRPQGYNNQPNYSAAPVDISDLYNGAASHADQQLRARGFIQTRSTPPSDAGFSNSWWLNQQTNQCFQLETARATVMTLNPRAPQDCGGGASYQNNPPQYGGGNYQNNAYQAEKVDISDLRHGSIEHAEKQLYARGFNKVGGSSGYSSSYDSLWVNSRTSQCFKIIGANNTVSTIMSQSPDNCH